jgi:hypothetical protein
MPFQRRSDPAIVRISDLVLYAFTADSVSGDTKLGLIDVYNVKIMKRFLFSFHEMK